MTCTQKKSGNIAIETYNPVSKKKSGISVTKSDLWAHIAMNQVWIANTEALKDYIKNNSFMRLLESERIKEKIRNFEHDMWSW